MKRSIVLGLLLTGLSIALHFAPIWVTMLNRGAVAWNGEPLTQDFIAQVIEEHRTGSDMSFRRRPLTTWCVDALASTGLSPKAAFALWGFGLFLASSLLVHRFARAVGSTEPQALISQAAFHLSPTVLCAWFEPMYTYDEPLQYTAFLFAVLLAMQGRIAVACIAMAVSLIAHETSLFLLPAFIAASGIARRARGVLLLVPLALLGCFLLFYLPAAGIAADSAHDAFGRLGTLRFNFSSLAVTGETLGYLLMVLLLPAVLLARRHARASGAEREQLRAFWLAVLLNTLAVLIAAKAREARVFALPLLIAWPLLGIAITAELERKGGWRALFANLGKPLRIASLVMLSAAAYGITRITFVLSSNVAGDNPWHEYLALQLLIAASLLLSGRVRSRPLPPQLEVPS